MDKKQPVAKIETPEALQPVVELTMLFGSHVDKKDAQTILEQLHDKDVLLFEGALGWQPEDERAWNDVAEGKRNDTEDILQSMRFEPRVFGKKLLEGLANSEKRIGFCDLQLADALKTLLSQQREMDDVQRRIIPSFLDGAFGDALFLIRKYCTLFAHMNKIREEVMVRNIKEKVIAGQEANKDIVRVLAFFGALHTPMRRDLKDTSNLSTTIKLTTPLLVFSIQEEIIRSLRNGEPVPDEKYKQAIYEYTLAYLLARVTRDSKKLIKASALLARHIDDKQYTDIAKKLNAHRETPQAIFNSALHVSGFTLPTNEKEIDALLEKPFIQRKPQP